MAERYELMVPGAEADGALLDVVTFRHPDLRDLVGRLGREGKGVLEVAVGRVPAQPVSAERRVVIDVDRGPAGRGRSLHGHGDEHGGDGGHRAHGTDPRACLT